MENQKTIAWDIETIADSSVIQLLPPIEPDSRLKDPKKIEANIKQKEIERNNKLGLDPATCRICCFGWHYDGRSFGIVLKDETPESEKALLEDAWEVLAEGDHFVTFNGINFDVPVLLMRSLVNRVKPAVNISTRKYNITNHTDVRAILGNWNNFAKGNLDFYSRVLLGETPKTDFDGADVQTMFDLELYDDIKNYCMDDVKCTFKIYELVKQYYL